jgi:hypothetical protein
MTISTAFLWLSPLVLQVWLLVLLVRRQVLKSFPFFTTYTAFAIVAEAVKFFVFHLHVSVDTNIHIFVVAETIYAVLGFLAIYEIFRHIFSDFYRIGWFRFFLPGIGLLMLVASVLIAEVRPPVQASRFLATVFILEIGVRCLQLGMFFLILILAKAYNQRRRYTFGVTVGFGVSAFGILFTIVARSEFGTKYAYLLTFLPSVSYLIAVLIWLAAFWRPEPNPNGDARLPLTPEFFIEQIRRYKQHAKDVIRPWFRFIYSGFF